MTRKNIRKAKLPEGHIIPLNFDFMFTGIFNDENNLNIVENFIAIYFNRSISEIRGHVEIKSRNLPSENKEEKDAEVDLLLDLDGDKINVELSNRMSEGIKDRNVAYASKIHGGDLKYQDNDYSDIATTHQICLNNFKCNKNKLVDTYYYRNDDGKILTKKIRIDYVDLVNARENMYNEDEEKLAKFARALTCETLEDFKKEVGEIMEKEAADKLASEVDKYSRDDKVVKLYSAYSKAELERNTLDREARENAEAAQKLFEEAKENAEKVTEEAKENAKKLAEEAKENAKKLAEEAKENAKKLAEEAKENAKKLAEEAKENAKKVAKDAKEEANERLQQAQKKADAIIANAKKEVNKEAINKRNVEIAKKLLDMSMAIDDISKATGLTKEEIIALK